MGAKRPPQPHYSGKASVAFWRRINRLPEPEQRVIYAFGCALQDVERRVLRVLDAAERRRGKDRRADV